MKFVKIIKANEDKVIKTVYVESTDGKIVAEEGEEQKAQEMLNYIKKVRPNVKLEKYDISCEKNYNPVGDFISDYYSGLKGDIIAEY